MSSPRPMASWPRATRLRYCRHQPAVPPAGPAADLLGISIADGPSRLVDIDGLRQLIVDGAFSDGRTRDLTDRVQYHTDPAGVVAVDEHGTVTPLADGTTTLTATTVDGKWAQTTLTVVNRNAPPTTDFANQVVPVFTKAGCNGGSCHGKLSGQNGFRLSLLGFYPGDDYDFLVKEDRGRRLFPAGPANSLLIKKATNVVPHRGGLRIHPGSLDYDLIVRWIAQGMPATPADAPHLERISVVPDERMLDRNAGWQQLADGGLFASDGTTRRTSRDLPISETKSRGKSPTSRRPAC